MTTHRKFLIGALGALTLLACLLFVTRRGEDSPASTPSAAKLEAEASQTGSSTSEARNEATSANSTPPKLMAGSSSQEDPAHLATTSIQLPSWAVVLGMPARAIRGRVTAGGNPVPNAELAILSGMMPFKEGFQRSTRSDRLGNFAFPPQAATNWILTARAEGMRPEMAYVDLREPLPAGAPVPAREVLIEMQACSAWARGAVRDIGGGAIANAEVRAALTGGLGGHATKSTASGRYELCVPRLLGNTPPVLQARADGYGTAELSVPYTESTDFDFVLEPQATLSGTVVRDADGEKVAKAKISAFPVESPEKKPSAAPSVAQRSTQAVLTDDEGRFHISGLAPGRYELRGEHDELSSRVFDLQVDLAPGRHVKDFVIRLAATSLVEGILVREGKPVAWTPVHFSRQDPGSGRWTLAGSSKTLADGTFRARLARVHLTHIFGYPRKEPRVAAVAPRTYAIEQPVQRGLVVELPARPPSK